MKKIPLEPTIVGSYNFLFKNIVSIIGVLWFPILLLGALIWGLTCRIVPPEWWQGKFGFNQIDGVVQTHLPLIVGGALAVVVVALLVRAMVTVGILRHAVGEKTSTTFIYFSLGARVWLMIVVLLFGIFLYALMEIGGTVLVGAVHAGMAVVPQMPMAAVALVDAVLGIAVALVIIYVMLRMFFFLPAVVVAEHRLGVGRAWALGKGNVLRMIAVLIVVLVPVGLIVGGVFYLTVLSTIIFEAVRQHPQTDQEAIAMLKSLWPLLPALGGMMLVTMIAATGLVLGAIGRAYREVAAPEAAETVAAPPPEAPDESGAPETPEPAETTEPTETPEETKTAGEPDAPEPPQAPDGGNTDE